MRHTICLSCWGPLDSRRAYAGTCGADCDAVFVAAVTADGTGCAVCKATGHVDTPTHSLICGACHGTRLRPAPAAAGVACAPCVGTGWGAPGESCGACGGYGYRDLPPPSAPSPDGHLHPTKTEHYERVELFHALMGRDEPRVPTVPDRDTCVSRARQLFEECMEAIHELGARVEVGTGYGQSVTLGVQNLDGMADCGEWTVEHDHDMAPGDLPKLAKELADVQVVATGTFITCGIHDRPVLEAVDKSNLDKLSDGKPQFREDGKLLKPSGWRQPDIAAVLGRQP